MVTRPDLYRELVGRDAPCARYHECRTCEGMIFEGDARAEHVYDTGSYYGIDGDPQAFLERRFLQVTSLPADKSDNQARIARIRRFLEMRIGSPSAGVERRVADIGAGMGVFLHGFLTDGWHGTAIEPDPEACTFMRRTMPHVEVLQGYSQSVVHGSPYHLITLNRVVEHVTDPRALLIAESERLDAGGFVYLEVPDTASYYEDGPNNEAFGYTHFVVFSPLTLAVVVRGTPLEIVYLNRVKEPSGKFTLYAFLRRR